MSEIDHIERKRRKVAAYRGFHEEAHKRGKEMGRALGLSPDIIDEALSLFDEVRGDAPRTPQGAMVDCLYITANKYGAKVTTRGFAERLLEVYGVRTEPRTGWMKCN